MLVSNLSHLAELTEYLTIRDEHIRISEAQFRGFAEYFPAPAWLKDADLRLVWNNRISQELFPLVRPGQRQQDWVSKEEADQVEAGDRAVLASGQAMQFFRRSAYTGITRDWLILEFPVPFAGHQCLGGIAFDLTDILALHDARAHDV